MEKKYAIDFKSSKSISDLREERTCDKNDYLVSVACGSIGGLIDIFFVGSPVDSKLGKWTDLQTDNAVKKFAKMTGWKPGQGKETSVASAIGFLEKKYKVNYDQRHTADVAGLFDMNTKNHHLKSLSHQSDIVGLFFSILNQFTSTSSFVNEGKIITIKTKTFELQGSNLISKLFCGVANWFGHLMSDIAGSSGSRGGQGRGSGIAVPFYEIFQFCEFGKYDVGKDKQDLATIAERAFKEGYDFRFGLDMAIPVIITNLLISLTWSIRRFFVDGKPLLECIPIKRNHQDLRVMLIFGNATLCVIDGIDAVARSGGNFLKCFVRLNLIAWFKLLTLVLKEVMIRTGLKGLLLDDNIVIYKQINEALLYYLRELEKIDIELFVKETEEYNNLIKVIESDQTAEEFNKNLLQIFEKIGLEKPWDGDFNNHMSNKNGTLVFK